MPAKTKRRAKFDFRGRPFLWWVEDDQFLKICSLDKNFAISRPLFETSDRPASITVDGREFPGLDPPARRPVRIVAPELPPHTSIGGWVERLLEWSFDPTHDLIQ